MYLLEASPDCKLEIEKLTKKNSAIKEALEKKLKHILENPYHFKPLGNVLKGKRRVHILGCFVLTYTIEEQEKIVKLLKFGHHDEAY